MPVTLVVLYFAGLRDLAGVAEERISVHASSGVRQVLLEIKKAHPAIHFEGVRCAVNEEFVELDHTVCEGDTLALIPPVSGG